MPGGYPLAVLSELRARFIASEGGGDFEDVYAAFRARDETLTNTGSAEEVVLFFEHDLYDQLQLLQILFLLDNEVPAPARLTIVTPPTFIGHCNPAQLQASFANRQPIAAAALTLGRRVWEAFTGESPLALGELLTTLPSTVPVGLPHLPAALRRLAESYPHYQTELSRTEAKILFALEKQELSFGQLFRAVQASEEAAFMGDWSFGMHLKAMTGGQTPLVHDQQVRQNGTAGYPQVVNGTYAITPAGKAVLKGEAGRSEFLETDRWIGGVHISAANFWRWMPDAGEFVR